MPSSYDTKVCLHNQCTKWLKGVKAEIEVSSSFALEKQFTDHYKAAPGKVSITSDTWMADVTKMGFLGMTRHWIDMTEGIWELKTEVLALRALSGNHGGDNLGWYMMGLCNRVGITNQEEKSSKVSPICNLLNQLN